MKKVEDSKKTAEGIKKEQLKEIYSDARKHIFQDVKVGIFIALLLTALSHVGPGAHHALDQVYEEFSSIHPMIWMLATAVVCWLIALQRADVVDDIGAIATPVLRFVAHPSGVAIGLVPILLFFQGVPHVDHKWLAVLYAILIPIIVAILSHFGLAIAAKKAPTANKQQVRFFLIAACLATWGVVDFARNDVTANSATAAFAEGLPKLATAAATCWRQLF